MIRPLSQLKPGEKFKLMIGSDVMEPPLEFVRRAGEFAVCKHLHPLLKDRTPPLLSVPRAMVQLLDQP